jgi:FkbM family methyltransferase
MMHHQEILSLALKVLPKKARYSIRSFFALHDLRYHPELQLIDFHSGSRTILDAGANEGGFAGEILLRSPLSRLHCFEPNPNIFSILEKKCQSFGNFDNSPRAIAYNVALGRAPEIKDFMITNNSACSSFHLSSEINNSWVGDFCEVKEILPVSINTLDQIASRQGISDAKLLKIDTQGHELDVLIGATGLLPSIEFVYAETQFTPLYEGTPSWTDLVEYMWGQQFYPYVVGGFCLSPLGKMLQGDILFKNCRFS